jgi:hypothetical protein
MVDRFQRRGNLATPCTGSTAQRLAQTEEKRDERTRAVPAQTPDMRLMQLRE